MFNAVEYKKLGSGWGLGSQVLATNCLIPPNHFYKPANPTILPCVIQHSVTLLFIIHTLAATRHLLFHQHHQLLPLTCQISTSHHQVLHILHFSTFPLLNKLLSLLTPAICPFRPPNLSVPLLNFARVHLLHLHFTSTHHAFIRSAINALPSLSLYAGPCPLYF